MCHIESQYPTRRLGSTDKKILVAHMQFLPFARKIPDMTADMCGVT